MSWLKEDEQRTIRAIQAGDADLRERFLESGLHLVRRSVRSVTGTVFVEQEEEFAIALETFNGAIDTYRTERGVPFEAYARLLIRNRLLDAMRHGRRGIPTVSLSEPAGLDGPALEETIADPDSERAQDDLEYKEAVFQLEMDLHRFGLDLESVSGRFPKHDDSRRLCIRMARCIAEDGTLHAGMLQEARLPCAELSRRCGVPRKTVEKNRACIILLALLLRSELRLIHTYVAFFEREEIR
jgi:RNA polymerase sigma factor